MRENYVPINFIIKKVFCEINENSADETELGVKSKMTYRLPKDESVKRILLQTDLEVTSKENDIVTVNMTSISEFDTTGIENIQSAIENIFFPVIKEKMAQALADISKSMNIAPIEIK